MRRLALSVLFWAAGNYVFANNGDNDYAVSKIPAGLLKDAHVVKRFEDIRYEINSLTKVRYYQHYALTVLDENGDKYAEFYRFYDKFRSIESIEGRLYNANGEKLKSLKKGDIQDISGVSDISLMDDSRIKVHNFYYKVYPYTVEYEVEISLNNNYMFFPWMPQDGENYSVEYSSYSVISPADFTFHYKAFNYNGEPVISQEKDKKIYKWEVKQLPPMVEEFASPAFPTLTTCIFFSPDKFNYGGYYGAATSWQEMGKFQIQLNAGRDKLPDAVKQTVHQLTDAVADPKEKVRILYEYLQKNTRYISIQLGIGGFQPFEASYVASKSYGDCKALSNYMYSLLKEANIKSCYTEIKSGRGENFFIPDLPIDQFDHIILCVPLASDTMWLECTSQTLPAGYLGDFTSDRYALAVDENGGKLVHTPKYKLSDNLQVRKIKATVDNDATLSIKAVTKYRAEQQDRLHNMIHYLAKDKIKEYLQKQLNFATYDVVSFDYKEEKSSLPVLEETLDLSVSNYASITGKRLFIIPNVMNRSGIKLKNDDERKYDIVLNVEYTDIDSVEIEIPAGYELESSPSPVSVESKFGKYNNLVKIEANKIYYYRKMESFSGRFSAKEYASLVSFYDAIYKADRNRIVLVKKEGN